MTGVWGIFVRHIPKVRDTQSPTLASTMPCVLRNLMLITCYQRLSIPPRAGVDIGGYAACVIDASGLVCLPFFIE